MGHARVIYREIKFACASNGLGLHMGPLKKVYRSNKLHVKLKISKPPLIVWRHQHRSTDES